ncbi:MAG: hypothetical protein O7C59_07410, partial [Rickettsia endosymbiont of Ixodes persulcatus]|nr:hypothetical protein [Rickettsia endosymbiont of Ixodes persulcatus]
MWIYPGRDRAKRENFTALPSAWKELELGDLKCKTKSKELIWKEEALKDCKQEKNKIKKQLESCLSEKKQLQKKSN